VDRDFYYNTSQGSAVMDYAVFMNLELADSQDLFRSDANSDRYGLITQAANPQTNPDGLPVGLAKWAVTEGRWKGEHIGLTCAACHNGQLNYKGQKIRIDGGIGNTFDFVAYIGELNRALQATLGDAAKFDRLATRVGASSADAKADLRKRFEGDAKRVNYYYSSVLMGPAHAGPSRMDAISAIVNRLVSIEPNIPENNFTPLAPTKPPFLWNAPQGTWTQWRGVQQDPINRNFTEVMGVYMLMDLSSKTPAEGLFSSSAAIPNLQKIEELLQRLAPPKWPEEVFGKIDRKKAAAGKPLFMTHCAGCHNAWPYTWTAPNKYGKRFVQVGLIPEKHVGTDPNQFEDLRPYALTRQLAPYLIPPFQGMEDRTDRRTLQDAAGAHPRRCALEVQAVPGRGDQAAWVSGIPAAAAAKRRVQSGASRWRLGDAPFMHNGSVPNLYEMLLPAKQRTDVVSILRARDSIRSQGRDGSRRGVVRASALWGTNVPRRWGNS
jgi:mono/diheme cytochrome c family protein